MPMSVTMMMPCMNMTAGIAVGTVLMIVMVCAHMVEQLSRGTPG